MENDKPWAGLRPSADLARTYREAGLWRDATPAADLGRWARETPDAVAVTAHTAGSGIRRLTYREYADQVDRAAMVLAGLGVGPGQVVAVQLPNWWQLNAVVLACARLGATIAPVMTTVRARELERILSRLEPVAYVTTETWNGYEHAAALAAIADRLPAVKHRIIVGGQAAPGEIDLARRMEQADPRAARTSDAAGDPDRVSMILFTSGTTGSPKAAMHSFNTFYAGYRPSAARRGLTSADVMYIPHALAHVAGQIEGNMFPLYLGAEALLIDTWDPDNVVGLLAAYGATTVVGAPFFLDGITEAVARRDQKLPSLRQVITGATVVPASLPGIVSGTLGVTLQGTWGMTEVGLPTLTSADQDPPDWAARSIGTPNRALEIELRSDGEISPESPARMLVRGACACLATMGRDDGEIDVLAERDEGWYDTGDLAVPDGRGGTRVVGRAADRIGGLYMIPAADVEDALRGHPDITDAALVGYGPGNQLACAVVVSSKPLTLDEVRAYLDGIAMTETYQPARVELVERLPRNSMGKVDKNHLRTWLGTDPVP
ncbi:MAG TPA: AMP-binding protein [Trebonia sp.]